MPSNLLAFPVLFTAALALAVGEPDQKPAAASTGKDATANAGSTEAKAPAEATPEKSRAEVTSATPEKGKPGKLGLQTATFGGGCFWCTEAVFELVPGVKSVVSGYSGGNVPNPTYEAVGTGMTGHAEVVQIVFDPAVVSYETLLGVFWKEHDPTTPNAQGPDFGTQYRSIILYHNEDQKKSAQKVYRELKALRVLKGEVVTQLVPFRAFYPAEAYHQDYYSNHPFEPYSMVYIAPKVEEFLRPKKKGQTSRKARNVRGTVRPGTTHSLEAGKGQGIVKPDTDKASSADKSASPENPDTAGKGPARD